MVYISQLVSSQSQRILQQSFFVQFRMFSSSVKQGIRRLKEGINRNHIIIIIREDSQ